MSVPCLRPNEDEAIVAACHRYWPEDVVASQRSELWASTEIGTKKFADAYEKATGRGGSVFIFFVLWLPDNSMATRVFRGVARIDSPPLGARRDYADMIWGRRAHWGAPFEVTWLLQCHAPQHGALIGTNDGSPLSAPEANALLRAAADGGYVRPPEPSIITEVVISAGFRDVRLMNGGHGTGGIRSRADDRARFRVPFSRDTHYVWLAKFKSDGGDPSLRLIANMRERDDALDFARHEATAARGDWSQVDEAEYDAHEHLLLLLPHPDPGRMVWFKVK